MPPSSLWLRGIAVHDLGVRALGAVTFLALAGLGRSLAAIDPDDGPGTAAWRSGMATAGRLLVVAGLFGALGQLVELGGHQAAIAASGSLAPATTVGLIEFFVDQVGAAIATCAWAIFGVAALTGAVVTRGWLALPGAILGAALLVMAGSRLIDDPADIAGDAAVRGRAGAGPALGAEHPRDGARTRPAGCGAGDMKRIRALPWPLAARACRLRSGSASSAHARCHRHRPAADPAPSAAPPSVPDGCPLVSTGLLDGIVARAVSGLDDTTAGDGWSRACAWLTAPGGSGEPTLLTIQIGW